MIENLTPIKIVQALDKYIIGQDNAKKSVAIALRNRWRRQQIKSDLQQEITPNNIILIGPTGVGKTEIARRLSKLANAPFIKVEASKYTEVGYVGRDVESMIRELMDLAVNNIRSQMMKDVQNKASDKAKEKILDILIPSPKNHSNIASEEAVEPNMENYYKERKLKKEALENGTLDNDEIELELDSPKGAQVEVFSNFNMEAMDFNIGEMIGNILPGKKNKKNKTKKMTIADAMKLLVSQESEKLVSKEKVVEEAKRRVQENGIVFIDEIDKIASAEKKSGADVSRAGVQRDLLPIVEGSSVPTKYGIIKTDHILFIAAGAFHLAKPSDLIPELQGRFPIRVELNSLSKSDFSKILRYPKNSLIKQYTALFETEDVTLEFQDSAIETIADFAFRANIKMEDIGARRLHTILNNLLEDFMFEMPEKQQELYSIDEEFVKKKLEKIIQNEDLSNYIL